MSYSYQNVSAENGRSKFIRIKPDGTLDELYFTAKRTSLPIGGGSRVNTASAGLTLNSQVNVAPVGEIPQLVGNSVKVTFNILSGDSAALTALRTEINRVLDAAIAQYNLGQGLVPPTAAAFTSV